MNLKLFNFIRADNNTPLIVLKIVHFLSNGLIVIFLLVTISFWFWKFSEDIIDQRKFVFKTFMSVMFGIFISFFVKYIFFYERPQIINFNKYFFYYEKTSSFPSNHATVAFTLFFCFLFWFKRFISLLCFISAILSSWARVFICMHWPIDIVGSVIISIFSCLISNFLCKFFIYKRFFNIIRIYRFIFSFFIKKGLIFK